MKNIKNSINKQISLVIPCYNEAENLNILYDKIKVVCPAVEIIFVDDGSEDKTWQIIKELQETDLKITGIKLSRNFGQQAALEAGLKNATGEAIITMDADLQHPLSVIPELIKEWEKGFQIVHTQKLEEKNNNFLKNVLSKSFYYVFNIISDVKIIPGSSDFRLISKEALKALNNLPIQTTFLRGITALTGLKSTCVSYTPANRLYGKSTYNVFKQFELAFNGITTFSDLPLKLILLFGSLLSCLSAILFIIVLTVRFFNPNYFSGAALFGSFILTNTGLIIFILGIIAQYLVAIYRQISGLPNYTINEIVSAKNE